MHNAYHYHAMQEVRFATIRKEATSNKQKTGNGGNGACVSHTQSKSNGFCWAIFFNIKNHQMLVKLLPPSKMRFLGHCGQNDSKALLLIATLRTSYDAYPLVAVRCVHKLHVSYSRYVFRLMMDDEDAGSFSTKNFYVCLLTRTQNNQSAMSSPCMKDLFFFVSANESKEACLSSSEEGGIIGCFSYLIAVSFINILYTIRGVLASKNRNARLNLLHLSIHTTFLLAIAFIVVLNPYSIVIGEEGVVTVILFGLFTASCVFSIHVAYVFLRSTAMQNLKRQNILSSESTHYVRLLKIEPIFLNISRFFGIIMNVLFFCILFPTSSQKGISPYYLGGSTLNQRMFWWDLGCLSQIIGNSFMIVGQVWTMFLVGQVIRVSIKNTKQIRNEESTKKMKQLAFKMEVGVLLGILGWAGSCVVWSLTMYSSKIGPKWYLIFLLAYTTVLYHGFEIWVYSPPTQLMKKGAEFFKKGTTKTPTLGSSADGAVVVALPTIITSNDDPVVNNVE